MTIRGQTRLFTKRRKRLSRWHYAVTVLSAVIVFCTVYALILPAITMERTAYCGITAHEHEEKCFDSGGNLVCGIEEHLHTEECYKAVDETEPVEASHEPENELVAATEAVAAPTEKEAANEITVTPKKELSLAATGSEITSDSILYSKQIEKLGGDDDYTYRLHLTIDGTQLEGSTTHEEHVGGKTGIVLLVDVGEDFTATTSDNKSKKQVIEEIVGNYLNKFKDTTNKITVIAVRGALSVSYNDNANTGVLSGWNDYSQVSFNNEQVRYGTNYKAGLLRARDLINTASDNDLDKTAIVFITNSSPTLSVTDTGQGTNTVTNKTTAKTDILNYLPNYLSDVCPNTDIHILDVEQESQKHETPMAMGEYLASVDRGSYTTAASSTDLIDSFDKIIQTIIPGDTTEDLTVTDTLSENVAFTDDAETTVTATLTQGNNTQNVTVVIDRSNHTISYSHTDPIEGPFKLEIAFDIVTAEGVYRNPEAYPDNDGYPNTGGADTDWASNTTSSGKPGFFSNSSGGYSCTVDSTELSGNFAFPVVQAPDFPQPKTQTVTVKKHWSGTLTPAPVQMNLYEKDGSTYTLLTTLDISGEQDAHTDYTYTFADGETSKELYLTETYVGTLPIFSCDTVTVNLGEGEISAAKLTLTPDGEPIEVTVNNWPKTQMPATGGMGLTPIIMIGSALMLFSGVMLFRRRKRGA